MSGTAETITPHELAARRDAVVIDVRGKPDDAQIPGSVRADADVLLDDEAASPGFARDADVVVYCGSGNTCSRVAAALRERGYRARALEGGYRGWREAGLPVEPRAPSGAGDR